MNTNDPELEAINFTIANKKGEPAIYFTNDPSVNLLTFSFINKTGDTLYLKGGKPARPDHPAGKGEKRLLKELGNGSTFNFDFQRLLPDQKAACVKIEVEHGWDYQFFPGNENYPHSWSLAPINDIEIEKGDKVDFKIHNLVCDRQGIVIFEVLYQNICKYADLEVPLPYQIHIQKLPDGLTLPLTFACTDVQHSVVPHSVVSPLKTTPPNDDIIPVYISYRNEYVKNEFTLAVTNNGNEAIKNSKGSTELSISFLFGTSNHDLTTQELADNGKVTINVSANESTWSVTHIDGTPCWKITRTSNIFLEANETIEFIIKGIITPPDVTLPATSVVYVTLNNVPEYNDIIYTKLIRKHLPWARAEKIWAEKKDHLEPDENVTLGWHTSLARRVTLEYTDRYGKNILLDSDKDRSVKLNTENFKPPVAPTAEETWFTLTAYSNENADKATCRITVEQREAVIDLFEATPSLVDTTTSDEVTLTWKVRYAKSVKLKKDGFEKYVDQNAGSETFKRINTITDFTIEAIPYSSKLDNTVRQIRVHVYKRLSPITMPERPSNPRMQPRSSILVDNKSYIYVLLAGMGAIGTFHPDGRFLNWYLSGVMTLSKDGSRLFTYQGNNEQQYLQMFKTGTNEGSNIVGIGWVGRQQYITEPLTVNQMIVTPDLKKLFFTINELSFGQGMLMSVEIDAGNHKLSESPVAMWVGTGVPQGGMTFNHDGSQLFVGSYKSVSIVNINPIKPYGSIDLNTDNCGVSALIYHNTSRKLYIACKDANCVAVSDMANYETKVNRKIAVGNGPCHMLLSNSGLYLFVANFKGNTVSVINTRTDTIVSTLPVGNGPIAMAVNANDTMLFVSNYCDKNISVIDLTMDQPQIPAIATGGNPFEIVACDDGDYTRLYVGKEFYPQRAACAASGTPNLDVTVLSVQKARH